MLMFSSSNHTFPYTQTVNDKAVASRTIECMFLIKMEKKKKIKEFRIFNIGCVREINTLGSFIE